MGNADNIRFGYFDAINTNASGYSIQKVVSKTNENTLSIYCMGMHDSDNRQLKSSNYLSKYVMFSEAGKFSWYGEGNFPLTERQDKIFSIGLVVPVNIEIYLRKV